VDHLAPYRIAFEGLKEGHHGFQMEVDSTFFALFPLSEIHHGNLMVDVHLEKLGAQLDCRIHLNGNVEVTCDRCLESFDFAIEFEDRVIAKLGESTDFEAEVWTLGPELHELDLSQPIFEFVHLSLPRRIVHLDEADCDQDMLNRLDGPEGGNDDEEPTDPRWNALKELK
jgi:uncharacterized protein